MKYSIKSILEILNNNNFDFKKKFGQNFIVDENTIINIVEKSNVDKDTLVVEIGPGMGALTYKLCQKAKNVLCYEIDNSLKNILDDTLLEYDTIEVKYADFLVSDVKTDISNYNYKKLYVVANLPYYITTPIITKIIEEK